MTSFLCMILFIERHARGVPWEALSSLLFILFGHGFLGVSVLTRGRWTQNYLPNLPFLPNTKQQLHDHSDIMFHF